MRNAVAGREFSGSECKSIMIVEEIFEQSDKWFSIGLNVGAVNFDYSLQRLHIGLATCSLSPSWLGWGARSSPSAERGVWRITANV